MPELLTSGSLWSRWRGNHTRHSRRMRKPQFYVSGKRPMHPCRVPIAVFTLHWRCLNRLHNALWDRAIVTQTRKIWYLIDLLHKTHDAPVPYPMMHHFVAEMCTLLLQNAALWDICVIHWGNSEIGLLFSYKSYSERYSCWVMKERMMENTLLTHCGVIS